MTETQHVVSVGGGLASTWKLPEWIVNNYGRENAHFIMARLPNEDPDVWRAISAVEKKLDIKVQFIGENLTPRDVFFKERMMGNSRIDPCSRNLKRRVIDKWVKERFDPATTIRYIGFTYNESHRWIDYVAALAAKGWQTAAPLMDDPTLTRDHLMAECEQLFGFVPRLYKLGFSHNNCGGACVKAGHKEWARLLRYLPEVYAWWEENEERFRAEINPNVSILRSRKGGTATPLPLKQFREEMQERWQNELPMAELFEGLEETPACAFCMAA